MTMFNEEDIIVPSLRHLISQGIEAYVIDNWSTDRSHELVEPFLNKGVISIECFPKEGPTKFYELKRLLTRVEQITKEIQADWFIHHDVDEIRSSPWTGVPLRDAIFRVDRMGFNAIDHTVLIFRPTDNGYQPGTDFERYFKYFEFGYKPGHFLQIKAWKNLSVPVSLAASGGHEVKFEGRKVCPIKFILKHYPVRSQNHGIKKVLHERKSRFSSEEKEIGWHTHYDDIDENYNFIKSPKELYRLEEPADI
jgi:glycosyltransferase involved in cell wall biosynthesis